MATEVTEHLRFSVIQQTIKDVFISSETMMTAAMTTEYSLTFSNMVVTVNDAAASASGHNVMGSMMRQDNYRMVSDVSAVGSAIVIMTGMYNPKLYGYKENAGNIR